MNSNTIRILIADQRDLFKQGLASLLSKVDLFEIVGLASDGKQVIELLPTLRPDLVVMDIVLPILDGLSTAKRVKELHPHTEILFLSESKNEDQMRQAFETGGRAYLLKDCDLEELIFAIKKAARGDFYLSGPASQDLVAEYVKPLLRSTRPGGLMTQRERELARLLADGYSTKEAAAVLNISPKTAETHRASIMKKLNAKNVTDIVKYCIRNHIIEP